MRLLHFSDVHVQLPRWRERSLRELGPLRALATVELWKGRGKKYDGAAGALGRIVRDALQADHAVLTGDFTQLGHPEEFALAREELAPLLPGRLTTIAGNHDRYPLAGRPNRLYEEHFPERSDLPDAPLRVRLLGTEAALVAVDSCGPVCWPVISKGRVPREQLAALADTLRRPELSGRCKLVLVHHPPVAGGDLRDRSALLRTAADGGADALLCGHLHQRFDRPGPPRVICAGSSTELGSEGYWLLHVEGGRLVRAEERRVTP